MTKDSPYADKLDRSYFGFDQDYFERMPLLVNALQESNYVDPVIEMSRPMTSRKPYERSYTSTTKPTFATDMYKRSTIRRTSPRPFYFEYRSATPLPFSKTYGSRSWVDNYRNAQRLQNIRQVIKYLEKTINAKAADMQPKPTASHSIAFSGVLVEPQEGKTEAQEQDQEQSQTNNENESILNHQSDPYFKFKPDSPGEVNLLADTMFRFSPIPTFVDDDDVPRNVPMFKKISTKKPCFGNKCTENIEKNINNIIDLLQQSTTEHTTENPGTTKSFSVMLNLFPLNTNQTPEKKRFDLRTRPPINKIYLTTSKPTIQFRKKPTTPPVRRNQYRYKKPRYLLRKRDEREKSRVEENVTKPPDKATTMIVHVNVYSVENKTESIKKENIETTTSKIHTTYIPLSNSPVELSSSQVEDHHDGSSGVISVHHNIHPQQPQITTMQPYFENEAAGSETNSWLTEPTNILKFSPEDAKVPDHYLSYDTTQSVPTEPNRRSMDTNSYEETFIIKLKNSVNNTTEPVTISNDVTTTTETMEKELEIETEEPEPDIEDYEETTTAQTYVPQINGHYRSLPRNNTIEPSKRNNRKRRLEMSVTGFRTYVPMYVEIKRNKTRSKDEEDDYDRD